MNIAKTRHIEDRQSDRRECHQCHDPTGLEFEKHQWQQPADQQYYDFRTDTSARGAIRGCVERHDPVNHFIHTIADRNECGNDRDCKACCETDCHK